MKKIVLSLAIIAAGIFSVKAQTLETGLKAIDFERYEAARTIFKQLIAQDPSKGENYYQLGQTYTYLLRPDSAMMEYTKGITADPNNALNYVGLGQLYLEENKISEAKAQFDKALSFSKGKDGKAKDAFILAKVAEAMVDGETKLLDEALNIINEALAINKTNYNILIIAGDVMLERNEGGPSATFYEKAIDLDKSNPKAYTRVAGIWLRVRNAEATFTELNRALAIDSNYAPALKGLAEYFYQTKKFEKAKSAYVRYLKNSEESSANKIRFAQILFKGKEYEEALNQIESILKVDQSNIYLYRLEGYSYYEVGEDKKDTSKYRPGAVALETFLAKVDPKKVLPSDYEYLGKIYAKIPGRETDALNTLNKSLAIDSTRIDVYPELAKLNNKMRKYEDAAANYETYISKKKNPNAADYYLMAKAYYYGKQFGKADTAFMKVNEIKPDYAEGYLWRGNANAQLDPDAQTTVAKDFYEKYVILAESAPDKNKKNLIDSYDYLGKYAIKKDDTANAKAYFNKILALDPENKNAKEILKQLK